MFLSVFDIFKIGIGPSRRTPWARCWPPPASSTRSATARQRPRRRRPGPARRRAARQPRLHRQGPRHRPRGRPRPRSASAPTTLDPDERRASLARAAATAASRRAGRSAASSPSTRRRTSSSTTARRCPGTPTAWSSAPSTPTATCTCRRPTIRSAAASCVTEHELAASREGDDAEVEPCPYPFALRRRDAGDGRGLRPRHRRDEARQRAARRARAELDAGLDRLWQAMDDCIDRGLAQRRHRCRAASRSAAAPAPSTRRCSPSAAQNLTAAARRQRLARRSTRWR